MYLVHIFPRIKGKNEISLILFCVILNNNKHATNSGINSKVEQRKDSGKAYFLLQLEK